MKNLLAKERDGSSTIWKCPNKKEGEDKPCGEKRLLPEGTKGPVRCRTCKEIYIVHPAYVQAVTIKEDEENDDFAGNVDDPNLYCAGKWPNNFVPEWKRVAVLE